MPGTVADHWVNVLSAYEISCAWFQ